MTAWLDGAGRFFNPDPSVRLVPIANGHHCVVIDDALANPEGLRAWAAGQAFQPPGYPYPGHVCDVPRVLAERVGDHFALHVRKRLGARRTQELTVRMSVIDTHPSQLAPIQWMCHRDRLAQDRPEILFAAGVLYLFHEPAQGGTSFYVPRLSVMRTEQLVADSQSLDAHEFGARYGLQPCYMAGSNDYYERVAQVGAAWNRLICYDGGLFHSADVDPALLNPDPLRGRLTLNSFITCRRTSR